MMEPELATPSDRSATPIPATLSPTDLLRVARAGLMVSHLWAYLLPAVMAGGEFSWSFWVAAVYVTVPLGLLIYGWNDFFDADVDRLSPRKNSSGTAAVFGPRLSADQRAALPWWVLAAQLPFAVLWLASGRPELAGWLLLMAAGNALYNGPGVRLSRVPILAELTATGIYLLIVWLAILVYSPQMPWWCWPFAALSILNLQIMGTLVDVAEDAAVGKRTLSVAFGRTTSFAAVVVALGIKAGLTWWYTGHLTATAVMLLGIVLIVVRFSIKDYRHSSSMYTSFIVLDWIWLALMASR